MAVLLWVVLGVVCFVGSLGAFVLALLKPRTGPMSEKQQAALAAMRKTFNFAHRGLFDNVTVPENSLAAFKKAVDHGYGFEFDVQLTADNKLAISHDDTICARLYEPSPKHSVDSLWFFHHRHHHFVCVVFSHVVVVACCYLFFMKQSLGSVSVR